MLDMSVLFDLDLTFQGDDETDVCTLQFDFLKIFVIREKTFQHFHN